MPDELHPHLVAALHEIKRDLTAIRQELSNMEDVLAGLAADEAELATIVPKLVERDEEVSRKLGEFEAKAAAGEVVPTSEVEALKSGFDQSLASLKALLPAEAPAAPAAPTKAVYTYTAGEGIVVDERFSPSGFEIPAVPSVPAVPAVAANPETGAPETPEVAEVPAKPAEPLYYFAGDTAAGETNGAAVAGYSVYTGATEPVPAA